MNDPFQVVLDIWEGNPDLDYPTLLANNVAGVIVRLNDMAGGHHMDAKFDTYWPEAKVLPCRALYFVYNPWVDGKANFDWLSKHLPAELNSRVFADIEVKYPGYDSKVYADNVQVFTNLCKARWPFSIYTGQWFLSTLSYWPTDVDYWWAAYPNSLNTGKTISWEEFHQIVGAMVYAWNGAVCPGGIANIKMHQCSGGGVIMPGFGAHKVDVSVFPGTVVGLRDWMGEFGTPLPPAPPSTDKVTLTNLADNLTSIGAYLKDTASKMTDIASRL